MNQKQASAQKTKQDARARRTSRAKLRPRAEEGADAAKELAALEAELAKGDGG